MTGWAAIRGERPWGQHRESVEDDPRGEAAPRQHVTYRCEKGCARSPFAVSLAADAEPPAALDCRCGGTGRLDGAPEDAEVVLPGYSQSAGGWAKGFRPQEGMGPWGQLRKRREIPELEENLAERLAWVRENRVTR